MEFTLIIIAGQVIGGMGNGYLADRRGNKLALVSSSLAILTANSSRWLAPTLTLFKIVFFCVGIYLGSDMLTRYHLSVEYGPVEQRSTYIGLMNTVLAPLYLFGFLGGWVSDTFGYTTLFIISAFFFRGGGYSFLLRKCRNRAGNRRTVPVNN